LVAGATFTGTVLAIFFTLIALPIENILSRYSQDMIKRVQKDLVFWGSFIFLTGTFAYDVILITFGATPQLTLISLALTIDSVLVLALLVVHTFYMLDVRNQLNDITHDIKKQIKGKIHKSEGKRKKSFEKFKKFLKL
jgi:hypothetical protein